MIVALYNIPYSYKKLQMFFYIFSPVKVAPYCIWKLCICKDKINLSLTYSELLSTDYTTKPEENRSSSIVFLLCIRWQWNRTYFFMSLWLLLKNTQTDMASTSLFLRQNKSSPSFKKSGILMLWVEIYHQLSPIERRFWKGYFKFH